VGYLNQDLRGRMDGVAPLRYIDIADEELEEYPQLAEAVTRGDRIPLVLVGDEIQTPASISVYWVEEQLASLGVSPFADKIEGQD
jgi:hypothetical protein